MSGGPTFITAAELAGLVRDKAKVPGKDYVVVDVRQDDYPFGNIPGAVNIPADEFLALQSAEQFDQVPKVIFHCALSQVRGPKCARHYHQLVKPDVTKQEVLILQGGFTTWQQLHNADKELIENYNAEYWNDPY
ncbi:Rhodanese-like domain-containing protein [Gaertneriomyces semiglobifer]|nr:Rhodanese-like domain-containing protein [Gaertneriomyces semiglobifer]